MSEWTASANGFLYICWNFSFIAGRSLWGDTKSLFRRVVNALSNLPCPCQHPWSLIQGPPHRVGVGEENAGSLKLLENSGPNIWIRGKSMSDGGEGMLTVKKACMESYAKAGTISAQWCCASTALVLEKLTQEWWELLSSSPGGKQGKRDVPGVWLKKSVVPPREVIFWLLLGEKQTPYLELSCTKAPIAQVWSLSQWVLNVIMTGLCLNRDNTLEPNFSHCGSLRNMLSSCLWKAPPLCWLKQPWGYNLHSLQGILKDCA